MTGMLNMPCVSAWHMKMLVHFVNNERLVSSLSTGHHCCSHIVKFSYEQFIIIIIISFLQGIYTHMPETNYIPREYGVAALLLFLFMVLISLVSVLNLLYFYISIVLSEVCVQCPIWLFSVVP